MAGDVTGRTPDGAAQDDHDQVFVILGWAWDVATAARLATRYPVERASVSRLAWLLAVIRIDAEHAKTVDLAQPLLAVPIPTADAPLVIDGWHRIHHAIQTGVTELPVVLLDADDERACRIMGGGITRPT